MTRPRRLYQEGGNYYYLVGGAKKKIKVPDGISQKQLQKINIKVDFFSVLIYVIFYSV